MLPHHLYLLGELTDELEFVERKIARVEAELTQRMQPYEEQVQRLCTIPGLDVVTAWTMLAELGPDMSVFPDAASWAGLCPGNRESAGKRLGSRMKKGNRWLRRALCQSAWAVTKKRDCFLTAFYYRQMARHGEKKAIMATAHQLLVVVYHMLRDQTNYRELGGDYYDRLRPERTANRLVRRLERLGMEVTLTPKVADPIPPAAPDGKRSRGRPCKCLERGIDCKHRRL